MHGHTTSAANDRSTRARKPAALPSPGALSVTATLCACCAGTAVAQFVDFDDIVIPYGGVIELDMSGDGTPDLFFRGPDDSRMNGAAFTVETAPGVRVVGTASDDEFGPFVTALPPGVFLGFNFDGAQPSLDGTFVLAHTGERCVGGWCEPVVRFVGVRVGFNLAGWVRVESRIGANGLPELVLRDMQRIGDAESGMPTLIDGFYMEQQCVDGRDSLTVWMGGVESSKCVPCCMVMSIDDGTIDFAVTTHKGGGCGFIVSPWMLMQHFPSGDSILPAGTFEITSSIYHVQGLGQPPVLTAVSDRGELHIGCFPSDINGDGQVDSADLFLLLAQWGAAPQLGISADLNGDGTVDGADLGLLLSNWS